MSDEWTQLFDGSTLDGWFMTPRLLDATRDETTAYNDSASAHPAVWSVEDGAIVGRQDPRVSGWGGYLVSERQFGSFELTLEMKPDWPADTGVMIRSLVNPAVGIQVLVDHRRSGSIGGFYGNGVGGFHAIPFTITSTLGTDGHPNGLAEEDPNVSLEPATYLKRDLLRRSANGSSEFFRRWKWQDWNQLRVRCVGEVPRISTWVNGVFVAEIDTATIDYPGYDALEAWRTLGAAGHIAFEVHDNDPAMGHDRWGSGAACRWRDIRLRHL